jgi:membrane-associated protease RseP (regulator of RpoE activity)
MAVNLFTRVFAMFLLLVVVWPGEAVFDDVKSSDSLVVLGVAPASFDRGFVVGAVQPWSPAQAAGIRPGDVIKTINGEPVQDSQSVLSALGRAADRCRAGQSSEILIERDEKESLIHATLLLVNPASWAAFQKVVGSPPGGSGKSGLRLSIIGVPADREFQINGQPFAAGTKIASIPIGFPVDIRWKDKDRVRRCSVTCVDTKGTPGGPGWATDVLVIKADGTNVAVGRGEDRELSKAMELAVAQAAVRMADAIRGKARPNDNIDTFITDYAFSTEGDQPCVCWVRTTTKKP